MKKILTFRLGIALAMGYGLAFLACENEGWHAPPPADPVENKEMSLGEIQDYLKSRLDMISLPDMQKSVCPGVEATKHDGTPGLDYDPAGFTVLWDSVQTFNDGGTDVYLFPMTSTSPLLTFVDLRRDSLNSVFTASNYFKLAVREMQDSIHCDVYTYLPEYEYIRHDRNKISELGYDLLGSPYSGLLLVSSLDGHIRYGQQYEQGNVVLYFEPRKSLPSRADTINVADGHDTQGMQEEDGHIYMHMFDAQKSDLTRAAYSYSEPGGGGGDGGSTGSTCSFCKKPVDQCTCFVVYPFCKYCGLVLANCRCCPKCHRTPCKCAKPCFKCGSTSCSGNCDNGAGGGITGGGSGGNTDISTIAPLATRIFRNSAMIKENWEVLERMLKKIMDDCMGEALYNGLTKHLNGKKLLYENVPGKDSEFDYKAGAIFIGIENIQSNILLHEMFHAYQAYQVAGVSGYVQQTLNLEIESHLAQYFYLSKLPEYPGSIWEDWYEFGYEHMKETKGLSKYLSAKGLLIDKAQKPEFEKFFSNFLLPSYRKSPYQRYQYMPKDSYLSNFSNINYLTKDC